MNIYTMLTVVAVSLLGVTAFGTALAVAYPDDSIDAAEHADGRGNPGGAIVWKRPVYDSPDGVKPTAWTAEKLELAITEDDFRSSMEQPIFRSSTIMAPSSGYFIRPDDPFVVEVAKHIVASTAGYSDYQRATAALDFVLCAVSYASDSELYGADDFWAFPAETLYLRAGDCEDTSILLCSIFAALGFDAVLLDFPGHMACGVSVDGAFGRSYSDGGKDYYCCETTGSDPTVGRIGSASTFLGPARAVHPADDPGFANRELASLRTIFHSILGL